MRISDWSSDVCSSDLIMASARSPAYVGEPVWSSTTRNGRPARAARNMVFTKLLPYSLYSHDVRITIALGWASNTACSPASLDLPYTLTGRAISCSVYAWIVQGRSEERRVGKEVFGKC